MKAHLLIANRVGENAGFMVKRQYLFQQCCYDKKSSTMASQRFPALIPGTSGYDKVSIL